MNVRAWVDEVDGCTAVQLIPKRPKRWVPEILPIVACEQRPLSVHRSCRLPLLDKHPHHQEMEGLQGSQIILDIDLVMMPRIR